MFNIKIRLIIMSIFSISFAFAKFIEESPHNLSISKGIGDSTIDNGEACIYCHIPYASDSFLGIQLWNKTVKINSFAMYGSIIGIKDTEEIAANSSLLCLGCHDGVNAINSIVNAPGSGINMLTNTQNIPSKEHPISIMYNSTNKELKPINTKLPTLDNNNTWKGALVVKDLLRGTKTDQVECVSCHDPHNGGKIQNVDDEVNFLRHTNKNSYLCLGCHIK